MNLDLDWSRWALKGHKGFKLTQDELKNGIDARMITQGLKKDYDGKWVWIDEFVIKQEEIPVTLVLPMTQELVIPPIPTTPNQSGTTVSVSRQDSKSGTQPNGGLSAPESASTPPTVQKLPGDQPPRQLSTEVRHSLVALL